MRNPKTALVLAGGGITGAVYEIGALRAIDEMLINHTINDFDIYVGTSAGALVNALLCNQFTPHEILQSLDSRHPELRSLGIGDIFRLNLEGLRRRFPKWPHTLLKIGKDIWTYGREFALSDLLWELTAVLPSGFYNGAAIEQYVQSILTAPGRTNSFASLAKELYIVATELDTGGRAVFSQHSEPAVPLSLAVAASSAIPLLYRPVRIHEHDYVDGGLQGAASLDLAIEAGAQLVVCVNPMTPLDAAKAHPNQHYIRERGFQAIINQSVRTVLHSSLRYHIKNLRAKYPDVDIILIQPDLDDVRMFDYNPMHYSSRLPVAEHGYKTVAEGLRRNFPYFQQVLAKHNIRLKQTSVTQLPHFTDLNLCPCNNGSVTQLHTVLDELEQRLQQREDALHGQLVY